MPSHAQKPPWPEQSEDSTKKQTSLELSLVVCHDSCERHLKGHEWLQQIGKKAIVHARGSFKLHYAY